MEINKQKHRLRNIFIVLEIVFLFSIYFIYDYFLNLYEQNLMIVDSYLPNHLFNSNDFQNVNATFILSFIIIVFTLVLYIVYLYMAYVIKRNNQHVLHIVDEINNDEFVPSVLEGEFGLLEEKVYNMKKNNDHYIEALESEKQEMSDYIENIAHQIKTPITAIRLNEDILSIKHPDVLLEKNQQSFQRLDHLLESLLKLTRLEHNSIHFDLQIRDIRSLFENVNNEIQPLLNHIEFFIQIEDCMFYYDEQWMKEALYNIIKNCIEEKVTKIYLSNQVLKNTIQITIRDNGKGIKDEDLPHIFKRFYRSTTKKKNGSGIGLALCKEIIEKHHGHIHVYNDNGAVFEIFIPLLDIKEKVI